MTKNVAEGMIALVGRKIHDCLYGENPQQGGAALYQEIRDTDPLSLANFEIRVGTPSYNNFCDLDRALQTMTHIAMGFILNKRRFPFIAVGVKHGNACGAAISFDDPHEAITNMTAGNPRALFGGLVMTNFKLDEVAAQILKTHGMAEGRRRVLDSVVAPNISDGAITVLQRAGDKCRIICNPALATVEHRTIDTTQRTRSVRGGMLVQDNYTFILNLDDERMRKYGPEINNPNTRANLLLAWAVGSTSTSNTISIVKDCALIGNGVGQQDRVTAAWLAVELAKEMGHNLVGSVAYSDSFFPFTDATLKLIDAGIESILTSSGSKIGDGDVINLCEQRGVDLWMFPDKEGRGFYGH